MDFSTNCQFQEPINLGNETTTDWEFSQMVCSTTDPTISLFSEGGKSFYLSKTWDYGNLFFSFFLFLIILFWISKEVVEFLFDKVVRLKRKEKSFPS